MLENVSGRKSKDVSAVKTEPECALESDTDFIDNQASWHDNDQSDEDGDGHATKSKLKSASKKKHSDSDWCSDDDFLANFSDGTKPKRKRIKKKLPKGSAKTAATKLEKFFCDLCDKVFHKKHRIQAHLRTHLGLKVLFIQIVLTISSDFLYSVVSCCTAVCLRCVQCIVSKVGIDSVTQQNQTPY